MTEAVWHLAPKGAILASIDLETGTLRRYQRGAQGKLQRFGSMQLEPWDRQDSDLPPDAVETFRLQGPTAFGAPDEAPLLSA